MQEFEEDTTPPASGVSELQRMLHNDDYYAEVMARNVAQFMATIGDESQESRLRMEAEASGMPYPGDSDSRTSSGGESADASLDGGDSSSMAGAVQAELFTPSPGELQQVAEVLYGGGEDKFDARAEMLGVDGTAAINTYDPDLVVPSKEKEQASVDATKAPSVLEEMLAGTAVERGSQHRVAIVGDESIKAAYYNILREEGLLQDSRGGPSYKLTDDQILAALSKATDQVNRTRGLPERKSEIPRQLLDLETRNSNRFLSTKSSLKVFAVGSMTTQAEAVRDAGALVHDLHRVGILKESEIALKSGSAPEGNSLSGALMPDGTLNTENGPVVIRSESRFMNVLSSVQTKVIDYQVAQREARALGGKNGEHVDRHEKYATDLSASLQAAFANPEDLAKPGVSSTFTGQSRGMGLLYQARSLKDPAEKSFAALPTNERHVALAQLLALEQLASDKVLGTGSTQKALDSKPLGKSESVTEKLASLVSAEQDKSPNVGEVLTTHLANMVADKVLTDQQATNIVNRLEARLDMAKSTELSATAEAPSAEAAKVLTEQGAEPKLDSSTATSPAPAVEKAEPTLDAAGGTDVPLSEGARKEPSFDAAEASPAPEQATVDTAAQPTAEQPKQADPELNPTVATPVTAPSKQAELDLGGEQPSATLAESAVQAKPEVEHSAPAATAPEPAVDLAKPESRPENEVLSSSASAGISQDNTAPTEAEIQAVREKFADAEAAKELANKSATQLVAMFGNAAHFMNTNKHEWNEQGLMKAGELAASLDAKAMEGLKPGLREKATEYVTQMSKIANNESNPVFQSETGKALAERIQAAAESTQQYRTGQPSADVVKNLATAQRVEDRMFSRQQEMEQGKTLTQQAGKDKAAEMTAGAQDRDVANRVQVLTAMAYGDSRPDPATVSMLLKSAGRINAKSMRGLPRNDQARAAVAMRGLVKDIRAGAMSESITLNSRIKEQLVALDKSAAAVLTELNRDPASKGLVEKAMTELKSLTPPAMNSSMPTAAPSMAADPTQKVGSPDSKVLDADSLKAAFAKGSDSAMGAAFGKAAEKQDKTLQEQSAQKSDMSNMNSGASAGKTRTRDSGGMEF